MQNDPTTRDELLGRIRRDRERFNAVVARVPRQRLEEPSVAGADWSVKDVLWHIAWGDRRSAGVTRAKALVGSDLWRLSEDERNAAVVREGRSRSLADVEREYRESYAELMAEIERLTDAELNDPGGWRLFAETVPGWLPWRILYDPGHYEAHGRWIEEGLGARR